MISKATMIGRILIPLLCLLPLLSFSQAFRQTIQKELPLEGNGRLRLDNQYGKIVVNTWEKNRVEVEVTISVEASSKSAAQSVFDRITIITSGDESSQAVVTSIEKKKKKIWDWDKKKDFQIDYAVSMPQKAALDLKNKFGDVYIVELQSNASVVISHGNLRMEGANQKLELILEYGEGNIVVAGELDAEIQYAKLRMTDAGSGEIVSRYSRIFIEFADKLETTSRYDSYFIGEVRQFRNEGKYDNFRLGDVENLWVSSRYTEVEVESLSAEADLDLRYGTAQIHDLSAGFQRLELQGNYTNFKLRTPQSPAYQLSLNGEHIQFAGPEHLKITRDHKDGPRRELEAYSGNRNAPAFINARLAYGDLIIK
jgi:hypothetical protein